MNLVLYIDDESYTGQKGVARVEMECDGRIRDEEYMDVQGLVRVDIPEGVWKIGERAFRNCRRLERVGLPKTLRSIERGAFSGCGKLRTVRFQEELCQVVSYAFSRCRSLFSLEIHSTRLSISGRAFYGCEKLISVIVPKAVDVSSITDIRLEHSAFEKCPALTRFWYPGSEYDFDYMQAACGRASCRRWTPDDLRYPELVFDPLAAGTGGDDATLEDLKARFVAAVGRDAGADEIVGIFGEAEERGGFAWLLELAAVCPSRGEYLLNRTVACGWPEAALHYYAAIVSCVPGFRWAAEDVFGKRGNFIANVLSEKESFPLPVKVMMMRSLLWLDMHLPNRGITRREPAFAVLSENIVLRRMIAEAAPSPQSDFALYTDSRGFARLKGDRADYTVPHTDSQKEFWELLENDQVAQVHLKCDTSGRKIPPSLFSAALGLQAVRNLSYFIENNEARRDAWSPEMVLLYVCANWMVDKAAKIVVALETWSPGVVSRTRDLAGRNALWYTFYNLNIPRSLPMGAAVEPCALEQKLLAFGCDPDRKCVAGLSWRDVAGVSSSSFRMPGMQAEELGRG